MVAKGLVVTPGPASSPMVGTGWAAGTQSSRAHTPRGLSLGLTPKDLPAGNSRTKQLVTRTIGLGLLQRGARAKARPRGIAGGAGGGAAAMAESSATRSLVACQAQSLCPGLTWAPRARQACSASSTGPGGASSPGPGSALPSHASALALQVLADQPGQTRSKHCTTWLAKIGTAM